MISVHRYKYSQDSRRKKLKKAAKNGKVKYLGMSKTHHYYEILDMNYYVEKIKD